MSGTNQPLVGPFRIIADLREAVEGWQFKDIEDADQPGRRVTVPIAYRRLEIADYTVENVPLFILRRTAKDFATALAEEPELVREELQRLSDLEATGASCL